MKKKTYRILGAVIIGSMGGVMGLSFAMGISYLPFVALIIGMGLMFVLGMHKPRELEGDERTRKIAGRAASSAYLIYTLFAAVVGLYLKSFGGETLSVAGDAILYSACGLISLFVVFYIYYNRKGE